MARPKGSKNKPKKPENSENLQNIPEKEQKLENQAEKQAKIDTEDDFMTQFEAAEYFGTSENTIKLWIDHRILEQVRGGLIPMRSIRKCKFRSRRIT